MPFNDNRSGFSAAVYSDEVQVYQQGMADASLVRLRNYRIDSAASDAGNTPTTTLRAGLPMIEQSTGLLVPAGQSGKTGRMVGILSHAIDTLDEMGAARIAITELIVKGILDARQMPNNTEANISALKAIGFEFIDPDDAALTGGYSQVRYLAANTTLTAADSGKLIIVTAQAAITLPAPKPGYMFDILCGYDSSSSTMTIVSTGKIVGTTATQGTITLNALGERVRCRGVDYVGDGTYKYLPEVINGSAAYS